MAYEINYEDQRFKDVEAEKQAALTENQETYDNMIKETEDFYKTQAGAVKEFGNQQSQLQQQQTEFAIEKIEQQREQAQKDYQKEQSAAYVDYQKQIDPHGVNAEQMASMGMQNTGYSESSKVAMYTSYQNRVATAREANRIAELNYDNMMKEAQLQNSSALAEIAFNTYQQEVELLMQGMNYKNQLLLDKANKKMEIDNIYENRWQNVLAQMNHENSLAEQIRQYNESIAEDRRQFNANQAMRQAELAEEKRQFDAKQSASYFDDLDETISVSFSTYEEAAKYMREAGVATGDGGLMTRNEWVRRKHSGSTATEVKYSSYEEYLNDFVAWRMENPQKE